MKKETFRGAERGTALNYEDAKQSAEYTDQGPKDNPPIYLEVTITYRDDKKDTFVCVDLPSISDWIFLYLPDTKRLVLPKEAVKSIEYQWTDE